MNQFQGFSTETAEFFVGLENNNTKEYWQKNQGVWEEYVSQPMSAFLAAFPDAYQPFKVFRMNRDIRFSSDKSPYKTMYGAVSRHDSNAAAINYLHLWSVGLFVAAGCYVMQKDQLERYRRAVLDEQTGNEITNILTSLKEEKNDVGWGSEQPLKSAPRGFPKDHPRAELLRWKGVAVSTNFSDGELFRSAALTDAVTDFWKQTEPLNQWFEKHVGKTTIIEKP